MMQRNVLDTVSHLSCFSLVSALAAIQRDLLGGSHEHRGVAVKGRVATTVLGTSYRYLKRHVFLAFGLQSVALADPVSTSFPHLRPLKIFCRGPCFVISSS
jgi:hypothetical protein